MGRFTTENFDGHVSFDGSLDIEEAIALIEFYKSRGYTRVCESYNGDSLILSKEDAPYEMNKYENLQQRFNFISECLKKTAEKEQLALKNSSPELKKRCKELEDELLQLNERFINIHNNHNELLVQNIGLNNVILKKDHAIKKMKEVFVKKLGEQYECNV